MRSRFLLRAASAFFFCVIGARSSHAAPSTARFYFTGDGVLVMKHAHLDETLNVRYRDAEGRYDPAALAEIQRFFRSRTDGEQGEISLRLIELVDFVGDRAHPRSVTLISAYRSPEMNEGLRDGGGRVAKASLHTEGLAADVAFAGVDLRKLWLDLRKLGVGGVGFYRAEGFLHIDTGKPRFWEPATSAVDQNLSADNARVFARTDYDRYSNLEGAVIGLHGVTALPIRIAREAQLGEQRVALAPRSPDVKLDGDCWVVSEASAAYQFVVETAAVPPAKRAPLRLRTCAPRVGATAAEILTNPVEKMGSLPISGNGEAPH